MNAEKFYDQHTDIDRKTYFLCRVINLHLT